MYRGVHCLPSSKLDQLHCTFHWTVSVRCWSGPQLVSKRRSQSHWTSSAAPGRQEIISFNWHVKATLCKNVHETKWSALNCTALQCVIMPTVHATNLTRKKKKRTKLTLIMMKNNFTLTKANSIKDTWGKACLQCYILFFKVPSSIYAHISILTLVHNPFWQPVIDKIG